MPFWFSMNLQNSNSPMMEFLIFFNDLTMILIIMIVTNLFILFFFLMKMKFHCYIFPESQSLEDLWLMIPLVFLIFIGFPSIKNLYMYEEYFDSDLTVKINGFQWYWSYETDFMKLNYDSFMKKEDFNFRLLETFNHLIVPSNLMIRFLVSSNDVIHSWTVPSLGIKLDATPGRLSQIISLISRPSLMVGQCSEICGANHSFMPIVISCNSLKNYSMF